MTHSRLFASDEPLKSRVGAERLLPPGVYNTTVTRGGNTTLQCTVTADQMAQITVGFSDTIRLGGSVD